MSLYTKIILKGFNIFHLLYVNGQFIPISNRSHAKNPASFCVFS